MTTQYHQCPGCGLRLPASDAQPDPRYNASAECWALYLDLTAYTLARGRDEFIHQVLVDAYGAQHVGEKARPIGVAFALMGLYLTYERGYSGRQVQHMHMLLANRSKNWPCFAPPDTTYALTVLDVMQAPEGEPRDDTLRRWGRAVWDAWTGEHERIKTLFERVMGD